MLALGLHTDMTPKETSDSACPRPMCPICCYRSRGTAEAGIKANGDVVPPWKVAVVDMKGQPVTVSDIPSQQRHMNLEHLPRGPGGRDHKPDRTEPTGTDIGHDALALGSGRPRESHAPNPGIVIRLPRC